MLENNPPLKWNLIQQNALGTPTAICYGGDRWVVGDDSGSIAYSLDGITWVKSSQTVFTSSITGICYGDGKFLAVESSEILGLSRDGGVTWEVLRSFSSFTCQDICYGNGTFVVAGGVIDGLTAHAEIRWSTDLVEWDVETQFHMENFPSAPINCLCYGNGIFLAGDNEGRIFHTKEDNIFWKPGYDMSEPIVSICYGEGKFIVAPSNGARVLCISKKQSSYITSPTPITSGYLKAACYGNGKFLAVGGGEDSNGKSKGRIIYSADGFNWVEVPQSLYSDPYILSCAYHNGKFIIGGMAEGLACCQVALPM